MIDLTNNTLFPPIDEKILTGKTMTSPTLANKPLRVVIDTDLDNEVDDFFALAHLALAHHDKTIHIEAIYAAPYSFRSRLLEMLQALDLQKLKNPSPQEQAVIDSYAGQIASIKAQGDNPQDWLYPPSGGPEGSYDHVAIGPKVGMERSFSAINTLLPALKIKPPVFKGASEYMTNGCPVRSEAIDHLIKLAMKASPEDPIYVMGLACATNLASALLIEPRIRENVIMTWTAGYPSNVTTSENTSFNLSQDVDAAQVLFSCGVPLVYLPGFYIGQQLTLSEPDMQCWFKDSGCIGQLLFDRYNNNPLFKWYGINPDNLAGRIWNIWDLVNGAWLVNPGAVKTQQVRTPLLNDDKFWVTNPMGQLMVEGSYTSYNLVMPDFVRRLQQFAK
ncbi:MAG: purine nucleosidase [Paraglaciecola sp.]|jgi:purine nucleosidase